MRQLMQRFGDRIRMLGCLVGAVVGLWAASGPESIERVILSITALSGAGLVIWSQIDKKRQESYREWQQIMSGSLQAQLDSVKSQLCECRNESARYSKEAARLTEQLDALSEELRRSSDEIQRLRPQSGSENGNQTPP